MNLSKKSDLVFNIEPSIIFLQSGSPYTLTLITEVGTNDSFVFTANAFFRGIALESVQTEESIFYTPMLLGFGTTDAKLSSKKVTIRFVAVRVGTYTLNGGVPGFEELTKTPLKMVIGGDVNNTVEIPELDGFDERLMYDVRKNGTNFVWKTVKTLDLYLQSNAPDYGVELMTPYIISISQLGNFQTHNFISDLFKHAIWRKVQDSNAEIRLYYLDRFSLVQREGIISNDTVQLFLIPATNDTIGTLYPYDAYLGNDTSVGLKGNFILQAAPVVNITSLLKPTFVYDLNYVRTWVVISCCVAAITVGIAFISVVRSHLFFDK